MEQCVSLAAGDREAIWIERCRAGDRDAFRLLYDTYKDRIYSFALYTLNGDAAAAEDVAQEVFVRVFQSISGFRRNAEFATWVYRMTANACIDELRRRKRCARWSEWEAPNRADQDFSAIELSSVIWDALADLPPEQRAAVLLKYFEERSYQEMSAILSCSPGTIASRLNRGLRRLAQRLSFLREERPERRAP